MLEKQGNHKSETYNRFTKPKRREQKHKIRGNQTTKGKKEKKHKINWKTRFKMAINIYLSLITLNFSGLGTSLVAQWLRICLSGFPGGAVVESLPANAGDTGSSPGLGGSHMPRSGWAHEPQLFSLHIWSLCPATGGAAMVRGPRTAMKSGPAPR